MVSITMALRGLGANKLRSFLTMLGVIIGVGAVIIAIAIGQGSRQAVAESMQKMGTNILTAMPGSQRAKGGVSMGFGSASTLKLSDADAILRGCPSIARVVPSANGNAQVKAGNRNQATSIQGVGEEYPIVQNHPVVDGHFFTKADVKSLKRVACLGSTTAKDLFDTAEPVGKAIRIKGIRFVVIGVMKEKGGGGWGGNLDDAV